MARKRLLAGCIIFILITGWIFSGWPQINNFPPSVQKAQAAVSFVGSAVNSSSPNAATSVDVSGIGIQAEDLILVSAAVGDTADNGLTAPTEGGYARVPGVTASLYANDTYDTNLDMYYKIADGTETAVSFGAVGGTNASNAVVVMVFRGVDTTTPFDTNANTATGIDTSNANPPSHDWSGTAGTWTVIAASTGHTGGASATFTFPTNYTTNAAQRAHNDNGTDVLVGMGYRTNPADPEDPVAFSAATVGTASANSWAAVTMSIRPFTATAPTVTTQAASNVESTTATCNGTITNTGGENATKVGCEWDTNTGVPYANTASTTGTFGVAPFTQNLTGLPPGTTIYARPFATNSAGTGYGTETTFLTKPAAPTSVSATDGSSTSQVTITWTKSTGATDYHVWRDSTDLGSAGDVATFNDTGADAPTITQGSTVASDGTSQTHVALSLSGTGANNGTTHTYKVVASNATGNSADSATDTGYRGVGALTYQWERSASDSDASYSTIAGATSATYNDTGAPADGSGRYYRNILNATGATQQISVVDRGYRQVATTISCNTNIGSTAFGTLNSSSITIASPNAIATMSCSGTGAGCTLYIKDSGGGGNPGLWNSSNSVLIPSPNAVYNSTATLSAGTAGYGIQATTTVTGSGGTLTISARYLQTGNTVGGLTLADQTLAASSVDVSSREVVATHKATVSASTIAGSYSDLITYSCLVN